MHRFTANKPHRDTRSFYSRHCKGPTAAPLLQTWFLRQSLSKSRLPASSSSPCLKASFSTSSSVGSLGDQLFNGRIYPQKLVNRHPPAIAEIIALFAALRRKDFRLLVIPAIEPWRHRGEEFFNFLLQIGADFRRTRHFGRDALTKRWAIMRFNEGAMMDGLTPRSTRRGMAPTAELVQGGKNEMAGKRRAMAISAVSKSRISPTKITSGSCRKMERRPLAKV